MMDYRQAWAEGEIEASTLLDAIDDLRAELAQLHKEADQFGDGIDWIQRALQAEAKIEALERQEPVAWFVAPSSRPFWGEYARQDAELEAQRCGGTAKAEPLYALPGAKGEKK